MSLGSLIPSDLEFLRRPAILVAAAEFPHSYPMRNVRGAWIAMGLAIITALFPFSSLYCAPQAQQSSDDASALITEGRWKIAGLATFFHKDGSVKCGRGEGRWDIDGGQLLIYFTDIQFRFPLPIDVKGNRGYDSKGQMVNLTRIRAGKSPNTAGGTDNSDSDDDSEPAPSAVSPAPVSGDLQQQASQIVQAHNNSLVFVTGSAGEGSGFIASMFGGNYLVTNVHVAAEIRDAAFKTLAGAPVQGGAASIAVGEDILCMSMPAGGQPFEVMQNVDTNAAIGDEVAVLGNAEGAGVVNTIMGKIVGIGPNLVEVDAPFVPGNSGSPIIHLKTGKVIGVATYLITNQYDLATDQRMKKPVVRRFGYRLDSIKQWQRVNWPIFYSEAVQMDNIESLTDELYGLFRDLSNSGASISADNYDNPAIKQPIGDWVNAVSGRPSEEDVKQADENLLSYLKVACESDVTDAQRQMVYDYFSRELSDQKQIRDQMAKALESAIDSVQR